MLLEVQHFLAFCFIDSLAAAFYFTYLIYTCGGWIPKHRFVVDFGLEVLFYLTEC